MKPDNCHWTYSDPICFMQISSKTHLLYLSLCMKCCFDSKVVSTHSLKRIGNLPPNKSPKYLTAAEFMKMIEKNI